MLLSTLEAATVISEGAKQKSKAPKSSEHAIVDQTSISTDSVTQSENRTKTMNKDKEPIQLKSDTNRPAFTPSHYSSPKYNLSPTPTAPLVHPLHQSHTISIHTPKTITKFSSIKYSMVLRRHGWKSKLL